MGDYHRNLTQLHRYIAPSGADYNLPALFDNYKKGKITQPSLRKNPQFPFGRKDPKSRVISKELLLDNVGKESPGVGLYSDVKDGTFEAIRENYKRRYPELTKKLQQELDELAKK